MNIINVHGEKVKIVIQGIKDGP